MGYKPQSPGKKFNALTTEPKSRLPDAVCQRLYLYDTLYRIAMLLIEATHHMICLPDRPTTADARVISYDYENVIFMTV